MTFCAARPQTAQFLFDNKWRWAMKPLPHSSVVGLHAGSDILYDTSRTAIKEEYSSAHIVGRFNQKKKSAVRTAITRTSPATASSQPRSANTKTLLRGVRRA